LRDVFKSNGCSHCAINIVACSTRSPDGKQHRDGMVKDTGCAVCGSVQIEHAGNHTTYPGVTICGGGVCPPPPSDPDVIGTYHGPLYAWPHDCSAPDTWNPQGTCASGHYEYDINYGGVGAGIAGTKFVCDKWNLTPILD